MTDDIRTSPKQGKKKYIIIFVGVFLLGISCGFLWLIESFRTPNHAVMREVAPKYSLDTPDLPPPVRTFEGTYVAFLIPDSYVEKRHDVPSQEGNPLLEQAFFTQIHDPGRKIAITVERPDGGRVEHLSSYLFRLKHPKIYRAGSSSGNGTMDILFLKDDPVYEITGYVERNGLVATLVLSSASETTEKLMADFPDLLKNLRWTDALSSNKK